MLGVARKMTDLETTRISAAKGGDRVAFEALIREHARAAGRLAYRLCGSRDDAEDIVQDAFVKAFFRLDTYRGDAAFRTWLLRIVFAAAHDSLRNRARHGKAIDSARTQVRSETMPDPSQRERLDAVRRAIEDLPAKQRAALHLKIYEDLDHSEIARVIGSTTASARVYLALARQSLRRRFASWWSKDSGKDES